MTYKLITVSIMILIVLALTYLKDGDKMDPPLKRRAIIDTSTILLLWMAYGLYTFAPQKGVFDVELDFLLSGGLAFFTGRIIQLVNSINPVIKDFTEYIKNKKEGSNNEKN